jgi:zinc protease
VAGDFDSEEVLQLLRRELGGLRQARHIERNPTEEPKQLGERRATVYFEVAGPIVAMAWHAPATGHEDAEALDVASEILSSGRTSRLYRALVYDEPIALGAAGGYWELARAGLFFAWAQVRPDADADTAEARLAREIERLRGEPVSEAELAKAKRALEVGLIAGQGSSNALASRIAEDWVAFGRIRPLEERLAAIRAVQVADVQRVAKTWLVPEGRTVVQLLPPPAPAEGAAAVPRPGKGAKARR